jgi:hypothetical protein
MKASDLPPRAELERLIRLAYPQALGQIEDDGFTFPTWSGRGRPPNETLQDICYRADELRLNGIPRLAALDQALREAGRHQDIDSLRTSYDEHAARAQERFYHCVLVADVSGAVDELLLATEAVIERVWKDISRRTSSDLSS